MNSMIQLIEFINKYPNHSNLSNINKAAILEISTLSFTLGFQNKIGIDGCYIIQEGLIHFTNLYQLSIDIKSGNCIEPQGCILLGQGIQHCTQLQKLSIIIEFNNIGVAGAIGLGDGLSKLKQLICLQLTIRSFNEIGQEGAAGLSEGIKHLINLRELLLNIGFNDIRQKGCTELGKGISKLINLEKLSLSFGNENSIGEQGAIAIGDSFIHLNKLYDINIIICDNNIGFNGVKGLAHGLSSLQNITKLQLNIETNGIQSRGLKEIAKAIQCNPCIYLLQLIIGCANYIKKFDLLSLAQSIKTLPNLKNLYLQILWDQDRDDQLEQQQENQEFQELVLQKQYEEKQQKYQFQNKQQKQEQQQHQEYEEEKQQKQEEDNDINIDDLYKENLITQKFIILICRVKDLNYFKYWTKISSENKNLLIKKSKRLVVFSN